MENDPLSAKTNYRGWSFHIDYVHTLLFKIFLKVSYVWKLVSTTLLKKGDKSEFRDLNYKNINIKIKK